ncbi:MAG TPA: hypothetical protein VMC43_02045 [Candidatus Paceibacterota bacterium]|nr:hypothetical protein [Candidatus Paceibacterota bacterium]
MSSLVVSAIETHLRDQFGARSTCCGVPLLREGTVFEVVVEPLRACNRTFGCGLDKNGCLPAGLYRVVSLRHEATAHILTLKNVRTDAPVELIAGYSTYLATGLVMDWRGVRRPGT